MSYKNLLAYQKGFELAMDIFTLTKGFPSHERFSLTDQIRRSSRAVCANLAEGYRKRQYPAHFVSKMSDCDMENSETSVWMEFALRCGYVDQIAYDNIQRQTVEVGNLLNHMINNPDKYGAIAPQKLR